MGRYIKRNLCIIILDLFDYVGVVMYLIHGGRSQDQDMEEEEMSNPKLMNYTTSISAERTISEIEKMLAQFGATAVMKEYMSGGEVYLLAFKIREMSYKLPANVKGVHQVMYGDKKRYHGRDSMKHREQQSYRVAWRIIKDWLHAQLSLIASGQAEPEQVLFPYAYDGKRTLYQTWKEGKLLEQGKIQEDK